MKRRKDELVAMFILLSLLLPIGAFFVAVTKLATPIEVQESVKLIDRDQHQEALARLDRFIADDHPVDHLALAYRAVAFQKLGNTSQARKDLYLAASHKWTFGNEGQFDLLPGDTSELACDELVDMLRVEERHKSYLQNSLCNNQ